MSKKVLIVGSGLAGLAAALRLSRRGYEVELVEKNDKAGGRLNQLKKDGFTFDVGPSFFSMSYEFDEFVQDAGIKMPFHFVELDPLYTVNFLSTGKTYTIYKDQAKYWMYETIHDQLHRSFFGNADISGQLKKLEKEVRDNKLSPFTAAGILLNRYLSGRVE